MKTTCKPEILIRKGVLSPFKGVISNFDVLVGMTKLCLKNGLNEADEIYNEVRLVCTEAMKEVLIQYQFKTILDLAKK